MEAWGFPYRGFASDLPHLPCPFVVAKRILTTRFIPVREYIARTSINLPLRFPYGNITKPSLEKITGRLA